MQVMKYLAILFGFYLLTLTLLPCGDVSDNAVDTKTYYSFHKESGGMENCNQEACAPFCSCNCCSIGKNLPTEIVVVAIEPVVRGSYSLYAVSAPSKQPITIWQPPKLA